MVNPPEVPCPGGFVYTIQAGDTIFALAQRFGTTVQAILAANPGLDPNRLFIGQRICIPVPQPPACPGFFYTIQAGDTLFALAQRFGTTVQAILAANPGLDPISLQVGRRICIPVPQTTAPPATSPTMSPAPDMEMNVPEGIPAAAEEPPAEQPPAS